MSALISTLPLSARSAVVVVPAVHRTDGAFAMVQPNMYKATKDKARAVIDVGLLFTGAKDARFIVSTDSQMVEVLGSMLIHVGAHPLRLRLGPQIVEIKAATLVVQAGNDEVLVMLKKAAPSGYARIEEANGADWMVNAPYLLSREGARLTTTARQTLERLYTALAVEMRATSLPLFDPALPGDYRLRPMLRRNADTADIEIEAVEIEIEPGCIEVCQD